MPIAIVSCSHIPRDRTSRQAPARPTARHHGPRLTGHGQPQGTVRVRVRVRVRVIVGRAGIQRDRVGRPHGPRLTIHEPRARERERFTCHERRASVRFSALRPQLSAFSSDGVDHPTRTKKRAWHPAHVGARSHARLSRPSWSSRRDRTDPSGRRHIVVVVFVVLFVIVVVASTAEPGSPTGWRWRGRRFRRRSQSSRRPAGPPGRPRSEWRPRPGPCRSR